MSSLTYKQARVRNFIAGFIASNGYSPSFEEIAQGLKLRSLATVAKHVETLQRKGAIKYRHGRARSIQVIATAGIKLTCPTCHAAFAVPFIAAS